MSCKLEVRFWEEATKWTSKIIRCVTLCKSAVCMLLSQLFILHERRDRPENTKRLTQVGQAFHAVFAQSVGYCQPGKHMQYKTENHILFTVVHSDRAAFLCRSVRAGETLW